MLRTCKKRHARKFATSEVEKGDQMIRQADLLLSEAIRIVADLYKEGLLKKPKGYAYPFPTFLRSTTRPPRSSRSSGSCSRNTGCGPSRAPSI